jgi:hypothetical protein
VRRAPLPLPLPPPLPAYDVVLCFVMPHSNPHVVWSADGQFLYCTSQDLTVVAWDVATGKVIGKLAGHTNTLVLGVPLPSLLNACVVEFSSSLPLLVAA